MKTLLVAGTLAAGLLMTACETEHRHSGYQRAGYYDRGHSGYQDSRYHSSNRYYGDRCYAPEPRVQVTGVFRSH